MRRSDLINSIQKISIALKQSNIIEAVTPSQKSKGDMEGLLTIFQTYTEYSKAFTDSERKILKIFNLDTLDNPKLWTKIVIATESESRDSLMKIRSGIRYFNDFLPGIIELLKQDHVNYSDNVINELSTKSNAENKSLLTVILPEEGNEISSPERLIKVLESINLLYDAFAIIQNTSNNDLSVAAIDSGSDKSFDFLGAAKLMESIKELIIGLWDRVVFFREKKLSERLDLITKSLPIIEKIIEMEQSGNISPEQAEILKRNIVTAANNFISAGAIIPELTEYSTYNPRQLMTPEPKLLSNATEEQDQHITSAELDEDDVSEEEIETMKKIIAKKSKKREWVILRPTVGFVQVRLEVEAIGSSNIAAFVRAWPASPNIGS